MGSLSIFGNYLPGWEVVPQRDYWEEHLALDVWYVDQQSFGLDLNTLFLTIPQLLKRKDIRAAGHRTMPEFVGSIPGTMVYAASDRSSDPSFFNSHSSQRGKLQQRDCGKA